MYDQDGLKENYIMKKTPHEEGIEEKFKGMREKNYCSINFHKQ